jgi:two-component system phosphate regulon sensor histidine kinase PhoR
MMDDTLGMNEQRKVDSKLKKLNSIMQKLTFQIVDPNTRIFDRISQPALDSLIRNHLALRQVNLPYEYGIYDQRKNNWYFITPLADTAQLLASTYQYALFPNDVFKSNEVLVLRFRDRVNYLIASIWPMLLSSLVFTAIIIFGFGYTIRTINRQKKLAMIKNDFINNMTHEFKTPIATIALANQSLRDPRVYQDASKLDFYTGVIKDENQRMLRQVENVLQMAQLDKGELRLKEESIDLFEILDAAIASMKLTVEERGGSIQFNHEGDEALVSGDANHLMNVFINVLDNANKYSPDSPIIKVNVRKEGDFWRIDILDQGIGMSRDVQKRIFETFYRAGTGNRHDVKGFGLGLSYVKAILEKHSGNISVESEPGKGSIFTITIPVLHKT